jgi:hypothetical protein
MLIGMVMVFMFMNLSHYNLLAGNAYRTIRSALNIWLSIVHCSSLQLKKQVFRSNPVKYPVGILFLLLIVSLPIPTHAQTYTVATHYPQFGSTDPAPRDLVQVEYGVYNNRETDYAAVDRATADDVIGRIQAATQLNVLMHNDWSNVEEDIALLQIVNNVPIEGALYTIVLPPGWNRGKNLPIVLSGNGAGTSNNRRLYLGGEIDLPVLVGLSARLGSGDGFIGAVSNCGGTESQGIDEPTYRSVGAFFDFMSENGGDKYTAMTAGWSRGGGTALMWAINPLGLDYEVDIVIAGVPPTHYGTLSQVSPLTYPSMASIGTLVGQDENAWNFSNEGLRPGMNPSPFMARLIGTGDPDAANAFSPIGMAQGLRGKQVLIEFGTHDAFFPLAPFLAFDRRLTELGIDHATAVTFNSGHEDGDFARGEVVKALTALVSGQEYQVPQGRFYFIDRNPLEDDEVSLENFYAEMDINADPTQLPVTVRIPYRAGRGNPVDIEICGAPGTQVSLEMRTDFTEIITFSFGGTIGASECLSDQVRFDFEPGEYRWQLLVDGQTIGDLNTAGVVTEGERAGCPIPATTTITDTQPRPEDTYPSLRSMGWGMMAIAPAVPETCGS